MSDALRVGIISSGPDEFAVIHAACVDTGNLPVAYFYGRSPRPRTENLADAEETAAAIITALPPGMDFLLPGSMEGLALAVGAYRLDLLIVFGFGWKLPPSVLAVLRLGAINVHVSMLPRYRGPAPLLWAIRNGDSTGGVTIHWMDEGFDTGNIIARQDGIPLVDDITWARYCQVAMPVVHSLLKESLKMAVGGYLGEPQDDSASTYAGFMEDEFSFVDWTKTRRDIHNQVRTHRYMRSRSHPLARIGGSWVRIIRTSIEPADGLEVDCGDGTLWITESETAPPPSGNHARQ